MVTGLRLGPPVELGLWLCAAVEYTPTRQPLIPPSSLYTPPFPSFKWALNPFQKENVDVYIVALTPSWPPRASIPAIAVTARLKLRDSGGIVKTAHNRGHRAPPP